ncbi:hypothetical protein [Candidatus Absconditicoccus praedator]|uniref:hypothetical protein n=1 Tax=Candidatus Absconditicoccus praedator TaxID=2735562 RepID=UPI001E3B6CFE|nr:hypothetical protein [Candidatus Absconditicoccus praedator]UFX82667.1 hypothetical protein HLG78_00755 [Candidatus Absconditicoccus praedator]
MFYFLFFYFLFFQHDWILGSMFLVLFFIFIHFLLLENQNIPHYYIVGAFLIAGFLGITFIGLDSWLLVSSILVSHIGIGVLITNIHNAITNRINISSFEIFTAGTSFFVIFSVLSYGLLFVSVYDEFNITCEDMEDFSSQAISYLTLNFDVGEEDEENIQSIIDGYFNKSVSNILIDGILDNIGISLPESLEKELLAQGEDGLISRFLGEKSEVDDEICSVLITNIKDIYDNPGFSAAVVFLLFLLFWPIFRLVLFIVSFVSFIFFKLLNLFGVYYFGKSQEDVDKIY